MRKCVRFKAAPKVKRIITVSFMKDGKRVTFQKTQNVPKRIGIRFYPKLRHIHLKGDKQE